MGLHDWGRRFTTVDVGSPGMSCLMLDFPLCLFFCSGRPALLVRWRIESTIGWILQIGGVGLFTDVENGFS